MEYNFIIIFIFLIALQIFRGTILERKYGRNKAYFITSLIFLLIIPYIFYVLGSEYSLYGWIILAIDLAHILYSSYILKFKNKK